MGVKKLFRRRGAGSQPEVVDVPAGMRPWWTWGPLGLVWFAGRGHDSSTNTDPGYPPHHGDAGNLHHPSDPGGGFGGFDGGGGAI